MLSGCSLFSVIKLLSFIVITLFCRVWCHALKRKCTVFYKNQRHRKSALRSDWQLLLINSIESTVDSVGSEQLLSHPGHDSLKQKAARLLFLLRPFPSSPDCPRPNGSPLEHVRPQERRRISQRREKCSCSQVELMCWCWYCSQTRFMWMLPVTVFV